MAATKRNGALRAGAWLSGGYALSYAVKVASLGPAIIALLASDESWQTRQAIAKLYYAASSILSFSYSAALIAATLLVPLGLLARTLIRARVRAGFRDPLARVRDLVAKHSRASAALAMLPAVAWAALILAVFPGWHGIRSWDALLPAVVLPTALGFFAHAFLSRRGLRAFLAPTLDASEQGAEHADASGFSFNAVAVTKETLGAVGALAAISAVMATLEFMLPTSLARSPLFLAALLGYIALAAGGAALFRHASRIAVGLDGIHVGGTTRARFISFNDIDGARANGSSLELTRGDSVVLRLQLHGEDAMRRDALARRIDEAITVAKAQQSEPAVGFVRTASPAAIDRAASGATTYRDAAPAREKLWEALESPAVDAAGRKAAATALARAGSPAERARLRVAAEHCAEPSVRARIMELVAEEEDEDVATPLPARAFLGR